MNKLLALGIAGLLSITMTGCAKTPEKLELPTTGLTTQQPDETKDAYYISTTDDININEVITIGDIMQFDGKYIHIIAGDLVEVFEYDNSSEKDFFLGQTVQIIKGETIDTLEVYERENFTISHTNMGDIIDQISGKLEKITDEMITVKTADGTVDIKTYEPITGMIGDEVTVYVMTFDTDHSAIMTLNENSKLLLTILEITRSDDGSMNLALTDADGGEYVINASHISMELDMAKLTVGDTLNVYHKGIMESWPMQLDTILIRK